MKVSACIMAKNEQEMLPRCLESIKDWVDEIILVDTGSTDKTVEIAKEYGAKVYHHEWQNDFSLHRNQTIKYATGDWIFIIDCDEEVVSDMASFKKRLTRIPPQVSGLTVTVSEISGGEPTTSWLGVRFFRKTSGVHYKNAVHNKAVYDGGCAATNIQMNHYGYSLSPEKMEKKRNRTEELLIQRLQDNPDDVIVYYYLTQMKIGQKDYDEAEKYGIKFFKKISISPKDFQYASVMYFFMPWIYLHKKDGDKAYAWAKKGLEFYPDDLDLNYIMARIGYQSKNDEWLKKHSDIYFEQLPKAKKRGQVDIDKFESELRPGDWYNRTVYTANEAAENDMRKFQEVLYAENR
jgi:glycosyltransferase involved in cell wall biosynthesis